MNFIENSLKFFHEVLLKQRLYCIIYSFRLPENKVKKKLEGIHYTTTQPASNRHNGFSASHKTSKSAKNPANSLPLD